MLNLKEKGTRKTILTYIEEDKEKNRTRHVFAINCCIEYYPKVYRLKYLKNCIILVCDLIKKNNLEELEIALSLLSKHKETTIPAGSSLKPIKRKHTYYLCCLFYVFHWRVKIIGTQLHGEYESQSMERWCNPPWRN